MTSILRLRVSAEADPVSLQRVLDCFQNINIVPRRVTVECGSDGHMHIEVDVAALTEDHLSLISTKIAQGPTIVEAYWLRP